MHARLASRLSGTAAVAALLLASGCTSSDDHPQTAETPDSPAALSPSTGAPSTPGQPSESPPSSATTSTSEPLVDRLIPTGEVPGLNAQWKWQEGDTGEPPADPFGFCAQTAPGADLLSIGASAVVARNYFPPDDSDDLAAEQVAEFPDTSTANRAWTVLGSWHKRCGKTADASETVEVRPFAPVPVQQGTARWYVVSWQPAGEETRRFEAFGMVLDGTRIAVLRMDNSAKSRAYPAGQDPMVGMVVGAAPWLD